MKKFLTVILSLLIAAFFAGCGNYVPPTNGDYTPPSTDTDNGENGGDGNNNGDDNPDPDNNGGDGNNENAENSR